MLQNPAPPSRSKRAFKGRKETHIVPPDPLVPEEGCVFEQTVEDPPNPPTTVVIAFGICVGDPAADPAVRVKDVKISHLSVTGFNGMGIFLFGVDNGVVKRVIASDNGEYGIFANNSTGTHISRNVTANDGEPESTSATLRTQTQRSGKTSRTTVPSGSSSATPRTARS